MYKIEKHVRFKQQSRSIDREAYKAHDLVSSAPHEPSFCFDTGVKGLPIACGVAILEYHCGTPSPQTAVPTASWCTSSSTAIPCSCANVKMACNLRTHSESRPACVQHARHHKNGTLLLAAEQNEQESVAEGEEAEEESVAYVC